jgi:2-isopropylmalate synthase
VRTPIVAGLARAVIGDIDRAWAALSGARRPRIHVFLATSDLHLEHKLRIDRDTCLERISAAVRHARSLTPDVEFSAEDATRSELGFLCEVAAAAVEAGATTINLPDTVGYALPEDITRMFTAVRARVGDEVTLSAHCHNDLGMAVANSLAGVRAGARQVECTINGIGERAGNAALEEIVMAIKTRGDVLPYHVGIEARQLNRASKLVAAATSFPVQYNKAIVGRNAFAHESGIHQDGMLKHTQTYEIMTPESVGVSKTSLVMGKHSGRNAFRNKLQELGYELGDNQLEDAFTRFKTLADKKKHIYDEGIEALGGEGSATATDRTKVVALIVIAGTMGPQSATLTLDIDGTEKTVQATGNGPVDATFNAIHKLVPHRAILELYQVHAVTEGTDAQAEVSVRLQEDGRTVTAKAADPDTLVASAKAYIGALNKLMIKRQRETTPQAVAGERQRLGGV